MKIIRDFADGNRYDYDFGKCNFKWGWAQVDTWQDASYYGVWVHPERKMIFTFCEGDTTANEGGTDEEFKAAVIRLLEANSTPEHPARIDGMRSEKIIQAFTALGLAEFLH